MDAVEMPTWARIAQLNEELGVARKRIEELEASVAQLRTRMASIEGDIWRSKLEMPIHHEPPGYVPSPNTSGQWDAFSNRRT